ncbi:lysozyme inhibitor LprI family protein [Paracoccus sp. SM22M-07]|uniref:lysozyme inhibitor LprI family protein n=1 Tax=Paracoccus sp. SM22M-07 TaxID=1520813 RepID=UPI00091730AF|nr:lysozyme inhibitor LprI family protein [Paracoccus sp. SM22M-07]OJH44366.1 hypothetical protein IE00_11450 [Paracoccus sp. SM22M-07]
MRMVLAALVAMTGPAMAQDSAMPLADPAVVDACLAGDADPMSCIGRAAQACMEGPGGSTTVGMSSCLSQELSHWDGLLNDSYERLMAQSKAADAQMADLGSAAPEQAPLLRQMQRDWIAYRDAACSYEGSRWGGGTGAGPAGTQCMLTQTARQYLWLDAYLTEGR